MSALGIIVLTGASIVAGTEYANFRGKKQMADLNDAMDKMNAEQNAKQDSMYAEQKRFMKNTATVYGEAGQKGKL